MPNGDEWEDPPVDDEWDSGGHSHTFSLDEVKELGGLLSPAQTKSFIEKLVATPTILKAAKTVKMGAPKNVVVKIKSKEETPEVDPETVPLSEILKENVPEADESNGIVGGAAEPPPWQMVGAAAEHPSAPEAPYVEEAEIESGNATVAVKMPDGTEKELAEKVSPFIGKGPMANVGCSMAFTKNMGNYENVKVTVTLHMPCMPTEIDVVFPFVQEWVDDRLTGVRDDIDKALKGEAETG